MLSPHLHPVTDSSLSPAVALTSDFISTHKCVLKRRKEEECSPSFSLVRERHPIDGVGGYSFRSGWRNFYVASQTEQNEYWISVYSTNFGILGNQGELVNGKIFPVLVCDSGLRRI